MLMEHVGYAFAQRRSRRNPALCCQKIEKFSSIFKICGITDVCDNIRFAKAQPTMLQDRKNDTELPR
jgi:hypothetical protein